MPYDEALAARIRELVASEPGIVERRMFGGLAFLVDGKMSVGASGSGGLMVRVAPEVTDALLDRHQPHAEPFIMRGRPITGWLRVSAEGVRTRRQLEPWVSRSVAYARALPDQVMSRPMAEQAQRNAELRTRALEEIEMLDW